MNRKLHVDFCAGLIFFALSGCARLEYEKVPTPTQYSNWSDETQREADKMKGVRYYLPRPFLHLKQSTPVAQRVALISFRRDGDKYILETPDETPTWVKRSAPKQISISQALAVALASPRGIEPQDTTAGSGEEGTSKGAAGGPNTVPSGTNRPPSELHARTGYINESDPVTRLGDRMDVVYLPDMEEQYVIRARSGLGTADIETRLRNGWAAEVFAQKVDNSNLIPYAISQFERASDAAAGIFTTWAPLMGGLPPLNLTGSGITAQEGDAGEGTTKTALGEILLFKLAEVKVAQPGLYPILKPREIQQWMRHKGVVSGTDPESTFELFLTNAGTPWIRPDMAFIPCPPFTMIGFNVTTDIFIAAATERIPIIGAETSSDSGPVGGSANTDIKKVESALKATPPGDEVKNLFKFSELTILTRDDVTTIILPIEKDAPDKQAAAAALVKWVEKALGADVQSIDPRPGLGNTKGSVDVTIKSKLSDLAKRIK